MGQITLEGMEFFAFHGFYDEEQKIGNKYGIDLTINTDLRRAAESDNLDETVNYEVLYALVLEEIDIATSDELIERYGVKIPVLKSPHHIDELCWPFDAAQTANFLQRISV